MNKINTCNCDNRTSHNSLPEQNNKADASSELWRIATKLRVLGEILVMVNGENTLSPNAYVGMGYFLEEFSEQLEKLS